MKRIFSVFAVIMLFAAVFTVSSQGLQEISAFFGDGDLVDGSLPLEINLMTVSPWQQGQNPHQTCEALQGDFFEYLIDGVSTTMQLRYSTPDPPNGIIRCKWADKYGANALSEGTHEITINLFVEGNVFTFTKTFEVLYN